MTQSYLIPVIYKGREYLFSSRLVPYGYIHRLEVDVNGIKVFFEPDEERNYRLIGHPDEMKSIEAGLLKELFSAVQIILH